MLERIKATRMPCYIIGDTNINLLKHSTHNDTDDFLNTSGFIPLINRPTRVQGNTVSCIDHIYTNNFRVNNTMLQGICLTDITDHYPIFHISKSHKVIDNAQSDDIFYSRKYSESNMAVFKNLLSKFDWANVTNEKDCQSSFDIFYNVLKYAYNRAFPVLKQKRKFNNRVPWITQELSS